MTQDGKTQWMAAYLYYNEPWENFLVEAVAPYIRTVMQNQIAEQFFFIRYWDRGPHIRLRFKAQADIIEKILKPNLEEHFQTYFESKPSLRTDPNYPSIFPEEDRWLPNNSIQYVSYEAEENRYGGWKGLEVAEKQFMSSSKVVLDYLTEKKVDWSYDEAIGTGIKLHLCFAHALGIRGKKLNDFFRFYFRNWLPNSFRFINQEMSKEEYEEASINTVVAFSESFNQQKDILVPFHEVLINALEENVTFEEQALNVWVEESKAIKKELILYLENGLLKDRSSKRQSSYANLDGLDNENKLLWQLYADYMHMTNNRLGIHNKDEGYMAFLILKSLENLSERKI